MHPAKYLVQTRSVLTIYRDCVKLIHRMVENPANALSAQKLLRKQFQKHKEELDIQKINTLKMNAVRGISNYLIYTVQKDYKLMGKKPVNILEEGLEEEDKQDQRKLEKGEGEGKTDFGDKGKN